MEQFDYIVVGAGSSRCVFANRLSADPAVAVLLIDGWEAARPPWSIRTKVRGLRNVRVCDTSVFPTLTTGHTNGAAMAAAVRLAQRMGL